MKHLFNTLHLKLVVQFLFSPCWILPFDWEYELCFLLKSWYILAEWERLCNSDKYYESQSGSDKVLLMQGPKLI